MHREAHEDAPWLRDVAIGVKEEKEEEKDGWSLVWLRLAVSGSKVSLILPAQVQHAGKARRAIAKIRSEPARRPGYCKHLLISYCTLLSSCAEITSDTVEGECAITALAH